MTSGSRRGAAHWAAPTSDARTAAALEVLIPTAGRSAELAVALAGLAAQDDPRFAVLIADQSEEGCAGAPAVRGMVRVLEAQGRPVRILKRDARLGMAEQRQFLLDRSESPRVLFLDDDVWLEPGSLARLDTALTELGCGFVGFAVQGLSYLCDARPEETARFEPWFEGAVEPETVRPWRAEYHRWPLHNAANAAHLAWRLGLADDARLPYRIAWIGACALFDRSALLRAGGFDFWRRLPRRHVGEDRVAQWRVMEASGGAGILPSGAVHLESPTTLPDRRCEASDLVFPSAAASAPESSRPAAVRALDPEPGTMNQEGTPIMNASINPIEIQRHLGGIDYPASKQELVDHARRAGADEASIDALEGLPDREYADPSDVSGEL